MSKETFMDKNKKIEDKVVQTYKKIEDGVVGTYKSIEDKFVDKFMRRNHETIEEAKERMISKTTETISKNDDLWEENLKMQEELLKKINI